MRGLLLKDFYMAKKHLRAWILMMLVFIGVACVDSDNMFLVFYPCMLSGMVPVSLLGYDERNKWDVYAGTLPCTRAQIVSAKYLVGLMVHGVVMALTVLTQGVRMALMGGVLWGELLALSGVLLMLGLISSVITLPFMFRFGVEKGRMAYYAMVAVISASSVVLPRVLETALEKQVSLDGVMAAAVLAVIALYAASWWLSIRFYEKRELK